jgi:hypothetical protein
VLSLSFLGPTLDRSRRNVSGVNRRQSPPVALSQELMSLLPGALCSAIPVLTSPPAEYEARSRASQTLSRSGQAAFTVIAKPAGGFRPLGPVPLMMVGWITEPNHCTGLCRTKTSSTPPQPHPPHEAVPPLCPQSASKCGERPRLPACGNVWAQGETPWTGWAPPKRFQNGPLPYPSSVPSLPSWMSLTRFSTLNCASNLM